MGKRYSPILYRSMLFICLVFPTDRTLAQESRILTTNDYQLTGPVKNCLVLTNYGREEFDFNRKGYLTKTVTRYNDQDYAITYYKYKGDLLEERRDEVYRDGTFDKNSSLAHFFEQDSIPTLRITEQIFDYSKEFVDRYEYHYDETGRINRILRSSTEGVDETRIEYEEQESGILTSYYLNDVLQKTVKETLISDPEKMGRKTEIIREYIKGHPDKSIETVYNEDGKILSTTKLDYDAAKQAFVPVKTRSYEYGENGMPVKVSIQENGQRNTSQYLYQFDSHGNWIKEIITPDNAYTTRRIEYYPTEESPGDGD